MKIKQTFATLIPSQVCFFASGTFRIKAALLAFDFNVCLAPLFPKVSYFANITPMALREGVLFQL